MPEDRRHDRSAIPGFESPAAGFDQPLEMLLSCHDRVRRTLDLLLKVCARVEAGRIDDAVKRAAADVLRYFDSAAPHHHEDEEQHLFPLLMERNQDADVRAAVCRLQEDHLAMESQWARLRTPLAALAAGHGEGCGPQHREAAQRFADLYRDHAATEESVIFPAAAALLDESALREIGREMASRRGVRPPD